ncbi:Tetratricopeptide repeat,Tetratricopeptide repeat-containing domain,Tetratricopeptide-like helical [Cinara cedri]|uniref:Tetratricopeptide repeat,Tetratricopeptide repeat-containing domain,Tetratricopeptide-like helical n=1 Tax=Cinara cedri TaxID=506608 RepID=A0A5E4NQF1_9HEMI|nr:Tetratricopeptide repeat,Tetratricopeptide repeat-containing domain,Tetratricopeptide-like helical [Cinara cedri]
MKQIFIEKCLLYGDTHSSLYNELIISDKIVSNEMKNVLKGDYVSVLENDLFLCLYKEFGSLSKSNFGSNVIKHLRNFLELNPLENNTIFIIGIACYQLFIQANWTGPLLSNIDLESWGTSTEVIESLVSDLDCVSRKVLHPELLVFSYAIFSIEQIHISTQTWWQIRMLSTLQSLLNELSNDIKNILEKSFEKMEMIKWETNEEEALFRLEQCKIYLTHYSNVSKSTSYLNTAMNLLGLEHSLVGAMGKRTKFQVKELAQLTLNINSLSTENGTHFFTHTCNYLPKDCVLDDENRLPDIKFNDESNSTFPKLNSLQQAAILNSLILEQKSKPKDDLQFEELQPYIRCLVSQNSVWSIHVSTLLQRSLLEKDSRRSVERAMQQIETLVTNLETTSPPNVDRSYLFHCSYVSPSWQLKAYLGNIMLSIGAIQSALDWFLTLDLWEECVACYNTQGLKHKAAEILEKELKSPNLTIAKTILILCLLGDATDDQFLYEKAWKISGYRSSRAQKHWAFYHYTRKEYKESIEHFKSSLQINYLQETLWFRLGFACMVEERWLEAAEAYRRYCELEADCFEAWNNLAKCYIKSGQKSRAYYALKEAVKCNYENWMVWDNLMVVSVDCGFFEEAMKCYHRLMDLKSKHVDLEVLSILVQAVKNNIKDENDRPASENRKCLLQLFGRLTSQVQNDGNIWKLYAHLEAAVPIINKETADKVLHHLQCAHRFTTQGNKWAQEKTSCMTVIELSLELAKAYIDCCNKTENNEVHKKQFLSSGKLMLVSVISQIEKEKQLLMENMDVQEEFEKIKNILKEIKLQISIIV